MRLRGICIATLLVALACSLLPATSGADQPRRIVLRLERIVEGEPPLRLPSGAVVDRVVEINRFNHGTPLFLGPGTLSVDKKSRVEVPDGAASVRKATFLVDHKRDGEVLQTVKLPVKFKRNGKAKPAKTAFPALEVQEGDSLEISVETSAGFPEGTELTVRMEFTLDGARDSETAVAGAGAR